MNTGMKYLLWSMRAVGLALLVLGSFYLAVGDVLFPLEMLPK